MKPTEVIKRPQSAHSLGSFPYLCLGRIYPLLAFSVLSVPPLPALSSGQSSKALAATEEALAQEESRITLYSLRPGMGCWSPLPATAGVLRYFRMGNFQHWELDILAAEDTPSDIDILQLALHRCG